MKTKTSPWLGQILALAVFACGSAAFPATSQAATVTGGSLTVNLDRNVLIASTLLDNFPDTPTESFPICCRPSIYVEEFWDASAASNTFLQLRDNNTPDLYDLVSDEIPATGLQYSVNDAVIPPNPGGREIRSTDFQFDPNNLFGTATGGIGLNGVIRFRVDVSPPTNRVLLGDMTLEYHPELEGTTQGRSGWLIVNHIGFDADAFELFDVTTQLTGASLILNGNLGFGWGFDHLGAGAARLNDTRIGTFSFQTSVVPVPAAVWLFASSLAGLAVAGRPRTRKAA